MSIRRERLSIVCASRSGVHDQTYTDNKPIDNTTENTDQQNIIGNRTLWYDIRQDTRKYDHQAVIQRKFLAEQSTLFNHISVCIHPDTPYALQEISEADAVYRDQPG